MIAEIISVGTEILLGDIVNTDAAYLSARLAALGAAVYHETTVGDNRTRLADAIRTALARADTVILSGGLGPTDDDITASVTAEVLGLPMRLDEASAKRIEEYLAGFGKKMSEVQYKQAMFPEGAAILPNGCGTAPGARIERDGKTVIYLPGPPSELTAMFEESVAPYLAARTGQAMVSLNLHLCGIGEPDAAAMVRDIMDSSSNPTVAPYAGEHEVRLRITACGRDADDARRMCLEMRDTVLARGLAPYLYAETDNPADAADAPAVALLAALRKRGMAFAAAESCTGGMIGERITALSGASEVFFGSIVSYANEVKMRVLGVKEETLEQYGAVSEQTAAQMAAGARAACGVDIAVSVTGIAGPGGGTAEKPVGTVCFGVATAAGVKTETMHFNPRGTRERIRKQASSHAMRMALAALTK